MSREDTLVDAIAKQKKDDKVRQDAVNARYDRIIHELVAIDRDWWLNYPTARSIMATRLAAERAGHEGDHVEWVRLEKVELNLKRNTIASYIVPAMNACIRAGFVKPTE